jgi:hypothetical protein
MVVLAVLAALVFSAPAAAQGPPAPLYEPAPTQDVGSAAPSDGGRSALLLGLAVVALAGAGVLAVLALRRPAREPSNTEVVDAALAALAPASSATPRGAARPAGETPPPQPVEPAARRTRRFRAARAASAEASAAARRGIPVIPEPPEEQCAWRPRVVASEAPLPAFGPGSHTGSPSVPPPPD